MLRNMDVEETKYGLKEATRGVLEKLGPELKTFYQRERDKLTEVMCSHVDDFSYGRNEEFEKIIIGELREGIKSSEGGLQHIGENMKQKVRKMVMNR